MYQVIYSRMRMTWSGSILHHNIFIWDGSSASTNKLPPKVCGDFLPYNIVLVQLFY